MMFTLGQTSLPCRAVVKIFRPPDSDQPTPAAHHEQAVHVEQSRRIRSTFVDDDLFRPSVVADGFCEKRGRGGFVAVLRQHEIKGVSLFVDCPVQIGPPAFDLYISFVSHLTGHCIAMSREGIRHEQPVGAFLRCASSAIVSAYFSTHRLSAA